MSTIRISAFRWVPPFAQGLVRDLRVRWALEEAGLDYEERLLGAGDQNTDEYRALQPFEQVPAYEEGDLVLFESGAIVLYIAGHSDALMPADAAGRARVTTWAFAALNSIEPPIQNLAEIDLFNADEDWARQRRPAVLQRVQGRLDHLAACLDGRNYLVGDAFTAADLLMTTVLRIPRNTDLVDGSRVLSGYVARCQARPAFQKALADQMTHFTNNAPSK